MCLFDATGYAFGGTLQAVQAAAEAHNSILTAMLADSVMGTDDTVLTALIHQRPELV